jgi:SulP family sulfate permease
MLNASAGALWHPWDWAALQQIHWDVIGRQAGNLAAVVMVSVITILLRATGIELITAQNADLNHELRAAGLANLVAGLGGGMIGFHSLIDAVLAHKMKATRLVGVVLAGICSVALVAGGAFLSFFPRPVLGGLLLFLGLDLIIEWVYKPWFKLPKVDYAMVILILAAINLIGFLEGVGLGLALAMVVFIVNYSSLSVVKHTLSGATYTSNVDRPRLYHQLLRQKGHWLYILELQGFIFFGTAQRLLDQIRQRIHDPALSPPHFVVLDFRLVSGLDSSAVLSFAKMKQLAQAHHFTLVLTHLAPKMQPQVSELFADPPVCRAFPDLDHGLEWCEDQAIETFESVGLSAKPPTLLKQLEKGLPRTVNAALLLASFERREFAPGACLICQGAESRELYIIEMGQVTVQRQLSSGAVRLRTLGAGTIVGELGLYLRQPASASVVADQLTVAYSLTAAQLQRMEHDAPELASAFHRFIVGLLSERVARMNSTVQALLD